MNEHEESRIARAEALFREVNERIVESVERFEGDEAEVVCECSDSTCTERFEVPLEQYHEVRGRPTRFLLARGHGDDRVERLVRRRRAYDLVEKVNARVAEIVTRLDPRGRATA